jgi:hypothetical protein
LVNWQYLLFIKTWRHSKFVSNLCKIHGEKHPRAFVKVVEGNEIYNFPIHHSVHFSSSFGRETQSKSPESTHCAGHDAASRRARVPVPPPWRLSPQAASRGRPFPRPHAHRGNSDSVLALTVSPLYPPDRCRPPPCVSTPINVWPAYAWH